MPLEFELVWMPGPAATMAIAQPGLAATALVDVTATGNAIQPARRSVIEEYPRIDTTFDPAALDRVSTCLAAHTGR